MVLAKNYEITSTFVKVMQKKTLASFFSGHGVYISYTNFCKIFNQSYRRAIFWTRKGP